MKITDLLNKKCIEINAKLTSKEECLKQIAKLMNKAGNLKDVKAYEQGLFKREEITTTGVGNYIAMPHHQGECVIKPALAVIKLENGIEWDSLDGKPVKLIIAIASPNSKDNVHLDVLAKLSQMLMHDEFRQALLNTKTIDDFYETIKEFEIKESLKDEQPQQSTNDDGPLILAVTSCPTGVSHTYMAQESLDEAGKKMNVNIKVETNGSGGAKNVHTQEEIEKAQTIIIAADAFVDMERFTGKKVIECSVTKAINEPENLINMALNGEGRIQGGSTTGSMSLGMDRGGSSDSKFHTIYKHLMSGISHMIPFVVAGGILLAIAYLIDGLLGAPKDGATIDGVNYAFGSVHYAARAFHELGATFGLGLMFPVLAGFIAYSISGKPGIVSGFIGGFAATKGTYSILYYISVDSFGINGDYTTMLASSSSGFIGAIAAGFIAGYFTKFLVYAFRNFSRTVEPVRDMLIIPLISTFFVGFCMFLLNAPFGLINVYLAAGLQILKDAGLILLLAALVAALMAIDMGGPINKATHYFVLGLVTTALEPGSTPEMQTLAYQLMAANIVGIMVPPIGISIATWLFPQKFTEAERGPSLANFFIGLSGITESAIPYVAVSPLIFISSCVAGAAVGGVVSMLLGMEAIAPEGGTISYMVMGASCWKGILATFIGSFITAFLIGLMRRDMNPEYSKLNKWKGIPIGRKFNPAKEEAQKN